MKTNDQLEPTVFVIFGGAGDLTWRKLVPALYDLSQDRSLPAKFAIIAVDRIKLGDDALRRRLHDGVNQFSRFGKAPSTAWNQFAQHIRYEQGDFKKLQTYTALGEHCTRLEKEWGARVHRIFYMATPPSMFGEIPKYLGRAGLSRDRQWARIVVEKPIGYDLASARALNAILAANFEESQVFRIDHYLGKETVQNILAFRFANPLFEPIWNRRYVECVTITAVEAVGVEHRGGYYDHAGALRDMVQNHLMQLLCLVAMEPMVSFEADEIRNKKVDVLHAVRPIDRDAVHQCVVRGQYGQGWVGGKKVPGYREEDGVAPESQTETFVALRLFIDNWRWQGVPFFIRTGKRLPERLTQIDIAFRRPPVCMFRSAGARQMHSNLLRIVLQPHEGFSLYFDVKAPGDQLRLKALPLHFNYQEAFGPLPEAYETLILQILTGNQTNFVHAMWVEASWRIYAPLLRGELPVHPYPAGSWGPDEADRFFPPGGHAPRVIPSMAGAGQP